MDTSLANSLPRRSFLHHRLVALGARFAERAGAAVAEGFDVEGVERARLKEMALCDLSPLPRCGFKGAGTADWIAGQGLPLPEINRAARASDGSLIARLGPNDVLVLDEIAGNGALAMELPRRWEQASGARGFPVPRRDGMCWFVAVGRRAPEALAKLCAVDLRIHRFEQFQVAQTHVASISAVVIRVDKGDIPAFHLLADSASAEYWWDCLLDAMNEFSGRIVGCAALIAP